MTGHDPRRVLRLLIAHHGDGGPRPDGACEALREALRRLEDAPKRPPAWERHASPGQGQAKGDGTR